MNSFTYVNGELHAEEVPIRKIALDVGTPFYLYSYSEITRRFDAFSASFADVPHIVCLAMKANSTSSILHMVAKRGGGADVTSGGELFRAMEAGIPTSKIVFSGVGKSFQEIESALRSGILMFNVESEEELEEIDRIGKQMGMCASVSLRVNPDIDPRTHPYISTGLRENKFGLHSRKVTKICKELSRYPNVRLTGVSCHIGSQITSLAPFATAAGKMASLVKGLSGIGLSVKYLDMGGGLGISYRGEKVPTFRAYGKVIRDETRGLGVTLVLEPGRAIVGSAGVLVTRVLYNKAQGGKRFVIVDGAMNDLIRPSLYDGYHEICVVKRRKGTEKKVDVVGPVCESGDFLARGRGLPPVERGEFLAVMSAGAYGFTMSSNYNSRPRVPEVLVRGSEYAIVRERESYTDLVRGEVVPEFIKQAGGEL